MRVSRADDAVNQGATIAIDPRPATSSSRGGGSRPPRRRTATRSWWRGCRSMARRHRRGPGRLVALRRSASHGRTTTSSSSIAAAARTAERSTKICGARSGHDRVPLPHQRLSDDDHRRHGPRLHRVGRARLRAGAARPDVGRRAHPDRDVSRTAWTIRAPVVVDDRPAAGPSADADADVRRRQADAGVLRPARDRGASLRRASSATPIRATDGATPSTSAPRSARRATCRRSRPRSACPIT